MAYSIVENQFREKSNKLQNLITYIEIIEQKDGDLYSDTDKTFINTTIKSQLTKYDFTYNSSLPRELVPEIGDYYEFFQMWDETFLDVKAKLEIMEKEELKNLKAEVEYFNKELEEYSHMLAKDKQPDLRLEQFTEMKSNLNKIATLLN
ncbi:hypothetical protein [Natranaerofaba carboxydovora]|uniref:hypothetical protein n=1 Tax=Natranaerofaba carboxydovora TaxID=2742683 RepID=UPI001F12DCD3|nr:hypothetical protein [Natranaerofaba carboxydovora]